MDVRAISHREKEGRVIFVIPDERIGKSYLAIIGTSVDHKILLILIIHVLAKLTVLSLPQFSKIGIS